MSGNCQVNVKYCCGSQWFPLQIYLSFFSQVFLAILYFVKNSSLEIDPALDFNWQGRYYVKGESYDSSSISCGLPINPT